VIPPSIHDPSSPTSSGSPLRGPTTRSMMRKIQMGIPLNDHQDQSSTHYSHGLRKSPRYEGLHVIAVE